MNSRTSDDLPTDVRRLIECCVRSVGHLEMLLFLFQTRPRSYTTAELGRELRTNESLADHHLHELSPYIRHEGERFSYAASGDSDATLQKLSDLYRERRHAIINAIYLKPPDALRSFADAFKIKKD